MVDALLLAIPCTVLSVFNAPNDGVSEQIQMMSKFLCLPGPLVWLVCYTDRERKAQAIVTAVFKNPCIHLLLIQTNRVQNKAYEQL